MPAHNTLSPKPNLPFGWQSSLTAYGIIRPQRVNPSSASIIYINGLVQERHNSSALAMELRLSCINLLICVDSEFENRCACGCPCTYQYQAISRHSFDYQSRMFTQSEKSCQIISTPHAQGSLWPSEVIWQHKTRTILVWGMAWGTKHPSERMLTYHPCLLVAFTWGQFHMNCTRYQSLISIWKLLI